MAKKFNLNENYFNIIDSEDKAYFLGLLYADGANYNNTVSISLQEEDKKIIEIFVKYIEYTGKLYFRKAKKVTYKNQYRLDLHSKTLTQALIKLGCVPKKSLILKFPNKKQVPKKLLHHFIRGYFDGDGSVSFSKVNNYYYPNFSIVGTKDVCENIIKIFNTKCAIKTLYLEKYGENTFKVRTGAQKSCLKIYNYLYKDATLYLERKKEKFLSIRNFRISAKKNEFHFNMKKIIDTKNNIIFNNRAEAANYFKVSKSSIGRYIKLNKLQLYDNK